MTDFKSRNAREPHITIDLDNVILSCKKIYREQR